MTADLAGQAVRYYRLSDVGPLAGNVTELAQLDLPTHLIPGANADSHENTLGMNESGAIVGGFYSSAASAVHAFVWLPRAAYGLPAGLTDLHVAVWGTGGGQSWASDINNAGLVAGQKGQNISSSSHAHVWSLGSTVTATDLHTTSGTFSAASAINDETIARVAGQTTLTCAATCQPPFQLEDLEFVGFQRTVSPSDSMELLLPQGSSGSLANGLRTASPQRVAGGDLRLLDEGESPCCVDPIAQPSCPHPDHDSLVWTLTGGGAVSSTLPGIASSEDQGALAADINEDGDVVGVGWNLEQGSCPAYALAWMASETPPGAHNLGFELPTPTASRAHAVTDRDEYGCLTVVGRAIDVDQGLIWYGSGSSWCAEKLSDLVLPEACVEVAGRSIISAQDVNNRRVAAVVYLKPVAPPGVGNEYRAGLITDAADLNGDLRINSLDRAILMAAYCGGSNPPCTGKPEADLNCDGAVDAADLTIFAARWTGGALLTLRPICACTTSESMAAGGEFDESAAAAEAIAMLGFSPQSFSDWLKEASEESADSACEHVATWVESKKGGA